MSCQCRQGADSLPFPRSFPTASPSSQVKVNADTQGRLFRAIMIAVLGQVSTAEDTWLRLVVPKSCSTSDCPANLQKSDSKCIQRLRRGRSVPGKSLDVRVQAFDSRPCTSPSSGSTTGQKARCQFPSLLRIGVHTRTQTARQNQRHRNTASPRKTMQTMVMPQKS